MKEHLSKAIETGLSLSALIIIYQIALGAFSIGTRNAIRDRARRKNDGILASEVSGDSDGPFEAAHINHDKRNPNYDRENNGLLMTVAEHYDDHVNRHGTNGLHPLANIDAIETIWERMTPEEKSTRRPPVFYVETLLAQKHFDRWTMEKDRRKKPNRAFRSLR